MVRVVKTVDEAQVWLCCASMSYYHGNKVCPPTQGLSGEILITARTDPGWVPLYPLCSGLVIERGRWVGGEVGGEVGGGWEGEVGGEVGGGWEGRWEDEGSEVYVL